MDCLFCKIVSKEFQTNLIYEDEKAIAFNDINPQAPVHFLVVTKEHIKSLNDVKESQKELISHVFEIIPILAKKYNLTEGYRVVNNCGEFGGQTVDHIHFHVLGKREMLWPPG